jgi:hypothetical protein
MVDFVDTQVRDTFQGTSKLIAPLALIFSAESAVQFRMFALPVDLLRSSAPRPVCRTSRSCPRPIPTSRWHVITVFLLTMFYLQDQGIRGFTGLLASVRQVDDAVQSAAESQIPGASVSQGLRLYSSTCTPAK